MKHIRDKNIKPRVIPLHGICQFEEPAFGVLPALPAKVIGITGIDIGVALPFPLHRRAEGAPGLVKFRVLKEWDLPGASRQEKHARRAETFIAWIREAPRPFGLLAPGDWIAATYCAWLDQAGLRVPEDGAVLSRGNDPAVCECFIPTISAIARNDQGRIRAAFGFTPAQYRKNTFNT